MFNKQQMCTSCTQQLTMKNCTEMTTLKRIGSRGNLLQCIQSPLFFKIALMLEIHTESNCSATSQKAHSHKQQKHLEETNSERIG